MGGMERDEDGQRACSRGDWCASSQIVYDNPDGTGRRVPAYGSRAFCERDRGLVAACLDELPGQYAHLHTELGNPAVRARPVRVPFGPRIPIRVDIDVIMRAVVESLLSWHERVAAVARLSFPTGRRRDGYAVSRAVDVLAAHLDAMLALAPEPVTRAWDLRDLEGIPDSTPGVVHAVYAEICLDLDGGDAGMEIINLRHLSRAAIGETKAKPETFDGIPCRNRDCEDYALEQAEPPSDQNTEAPKSRCASCGHTMTEVEFIAWADLFGQWADSEYGGVRKCRRCQTGNHKDCEWDGCACRNSGHYVAALAA